MAYNNAPSAPSAPIAYNPPPPHYDFIAPSKMERFRDICVRHNISTYFATRLRSLGGFDIVLIADDSGSMSTPLGSYLNSPFAASISRWDELKKSVSLVAEISSVLDEDGMDLYFLNRPEMRNVTSPQQIDPLFVDPPRGFTPIANVFQKVTQIKTEKNKLIIVFTDGEPTDSQGNRNFDSLKSLLMHKDSKTYCTFVACTDDPSTVSYLNEWDTQIPRFDVVDDYLSERKEIVAAQGPDFAFSPGDYVVKLLLGSISPEIDKLDEKPNGGVVSPKVPTNTSSCCVIS